MPPSTSRHVSFDRGLLAILFVGILGAPIVWLAALQTGYSLSYQACDARSRWWVLAPTLAALAVVALITALTARRWREAERSRLPLPLLGWTGVGMAVLMVIVLAASSIAPSVLSPCD